jgi:hypothetical protein
VVGITYLRTGQPFSLAFNATQASVPGSFGRITSVGDPRQIQFGLKVLF